MRTKTKLVAVILLAILAACSGCPTEKFAQAVKQYDQDLAALEAQYGAQLDDVNGLSAAAVAALKTQFREELMLINAKYQSVLGDPNGTLQQVADQVELYSVPAGAVVTVLPPPYREIGISILGILATAVATIKRHKWKTATEELLYARARLAQRIAASDIDTIAFTVQREKAEGEALNPPTAKLVAGG